MFFDDKKKLAHTLVAKRKATGERTSGPAPMVPEEHHTEEGELEPMHLAAEDIMAAHHEKSAGKLREALGNFIDLHHAKAPEVHEEEA